MKTVEGTREPHYLARIGTEDRGPYDIQALETLALNGTIAPTTLLALENSQDFKPVNEWPFYRKVFPRRFWILSKGPAAFVTVNTVSSKEDPTGATRPRPICSKKELEARTAADPSDPMVIATMNEASFNMKNEGVTMERALKHIFRSNRELNRHNDRLTKYAGISVHVAIFRRSATKYALVLGAICAAAIYYYPAARANGQLALELIGAIYVVSMLTAGWIVRLHSSVYYLMTAIELYLFGWSVWVAVSVFRNPNIADPFQALYNCLTRWHL
jgi:hypothetical protein